MMRGFSLLLLSLAMALPGVARAGEPVDPAWIGTWLNVSPDANNPRIIWKSTFTVAPNGDYTLVLLIGGKLYPPIPGKFEAGGGQFLATPAAGGPVSSGKYRLVKGAMQATYPDGKQLTWVRLTAPVPASTPANRTDAPAPAPAPAPASAEPGAAGHAGTAVSAASRQSALDAIRATPLPANLNGADLKTLLLSDFPLPPGADEADLFCLPVLGKIAGSGMQKRKFRVVY